MTIEDSRSGADRPRRGSAGAPPSARWTRIYDAILRSPVLTSDDVRAYGVAASMVDQRVGSGEATVAEIAAFARLDRETARGSLQKLLGLGVLRAEKTGALLAGEAILRWRAPVLTAAHHMALSGVAAGPAS